MLRRNTRGGAQIDAMRVEQATGKLAGLTPKQQQAIGLLLGGCSLTDAAGRVGVSRGTLYQWRRSEKFIAALESWQGDMEQAARSRLLNLSGVGMKAILSALQGGDAKVALALFKGLGIFAASRDATPREVVVVRRAVRREAGEVRTEAPVPIGIE